MEKSQEHILPFWLKKKVHVHRKFWKGIQQNDNS